MNLNKQEYRLLNEYQDGFPLEPRPYERIGGELGMTEDEVLETLADLSTRGAIGRVGAVVRPNTAGASTLAAMRVPKRRLEEVAAAVNARPEVNHNYERDHAINLWFVVTGSDKDAVHCTLTDIEAETGISILDLPLLTAFHINLGFDLKCSPT